MSPHPVDTFPFDFSNKANQKLYKTIFKVIKDPKDIEILAAQSGIDIGNVNLNKGPKKIWFDLITEARNQDQLKELLQQISFDITALQAPINDYLNDNPNDVQIFISCSYQDTTSVSNAYFCLKENNYTVWFDQIEIEPVDEHNKNILGIFAYPPKMVI